MREKDTTPLAERLLNLSDELRAVALELLEPRPGAAFDARVSALLDRVRSERERRA